MAFFEIAVEPTAIRTYRDLQLVLSHIGFGKGRLLADYPNAGPDKERKTENWVRQVLESVKRSDIGKAPKVEALLISEKKKILRSRREYKHDDTWINNARREHSSKPFGAIITEHSPSGDDECCLDDFSGEDCPSCLREDQHVRPLPKTPEAFADALMPMLGCAKDLRFVDPYFLKCDSSGKLTVSPKHGRVVQEIARRLESINRIPQRIEFHLLEETGSIEPGKQMLGFANAMESYLPRTWKSQVFLWSEKLGGRRFHARYVLTDVGGTGSEYGLDQGNSPGDETDLYLLPDSLRLKRIHDFSADGEAFTLAATPLEFHGIRG